MVEYFTINYKFSVFCTGQHVLYEKCTGGLAMSPRVYIIAGKDGSIAPR